MPAFNQAKVSERHFVVGLAIEGAGSPRFVSNKPLDWITTALMDAKLFKTEDGAKRWLSDRPEVKGLVFRAEVTRLARSRRLIEVTLDPEVYLSTSGGLWTVISQGQQLCASTPERSRAEACATHFKISLPLPVWLGDEGRFDLVKF